MKNKTSLAIICLVLIAVITAGFFLLGFERTALAYTSLGFLLGSFVVSFLVLFLTITRQSNEKVMFNSGVLSVTFVFQLAAIIFTLLTGAFDKIGVFVFWEIVLYAIYLIMVVVVIVSSNYVNDSNAKTAKKLKNGDYNKPKRGGF